MGEEMSKARFQLVYDGPALQNHSMDVQELAPALLALGNLCIETNRILNKERTHVKVFIKSDFKRGSFPIDLEVVQSLVERLPDIFKDPRVMTAKELLEWLGIISGVAGGYGLWQYLKTRKGRNIESVEYKQSADGKNVVHIQFEGDNNKFCFPQLIHELGENERVSQTCKEIIRPLQKTGIDKIEFKEKGEIYECITKEEANAIIETETETEDEGKIRSQIIDALLTVYTPTFDIEKKKWWFKHGDTPINVDISDTGISEETLKRGYVVVGDAYTVKLEITQRKTGMGKYVNDYKIKEILKFIPGSYQPGLDYGS